MLLVQRVHNVLGAGYKKGPGGEQLVRVLEFARETCPVVKPSRMRSSARCGNNVGYTDGNCLRE